MPCFLGLSTKPSSDTASMAIIAAGPSCAPAVSHNCCRTLLCFPGCSAPVPTAEGLVSPGGDLLPRVPGSLWPLLLGSLGVPCPCQVPGGQCESRVGAHPARGVLSLQWGYVLPQAMVTVLPAPPAPPHARSTSRALFALGSGSGRSNVDQAHERCPPPAAQSHQTLTGTLLTPWAHGA